MGKSMSRLEFMLHLVAGASLIKSETGDGYILDYSTEDAFITAETLDRVSEYLDSESSCYIQKILASTSKIVKLADQSKSLSDLQSTAQLIWDLKAFLQFLEFRSSAQQVEDALSESINCLKQLTEGAFEQRKRLLGRMSLEIQNEFVKLGCTGSHYQEYLLTPEWSEKRKRKLQQANNRCQKCSRTTNLEVHHLNYDRIPDEWDADLIVLCKFHHKRSHGREIQ